MKFSLIDICRSWVEDHLSIRSGLCLLLVATFLILWCFSRLLTRTVSFVLRSVAGSYIKHASSNQEACFVATESGFCLHDFTVDASRLHAQDGPFHISFLGVSQAEVIWPSWQSQVLQLHIKGLEMECTQRQMPTAPAVPPDSAVSEQLRELEHVLWHGGSTRTRSNSNLTLRLRYWLLKAAVARIQIRLQECCIRFVVPGQLGPCVGSQQNLPTDALSVNVRSFSLMPCSAANAFAGVSPHQSPGTVSRDQSESQLLTQLTAAGVSVAVMTTQTTASAMANSYPNESSATQEPASCSISSTGRHWEQVHVLLRQWQCVVQVSLCSSSTTQQVNKQQTAATGVDCNKRVNSSAVYLNLRTASAAQVAGSPCQQPPAARHVQQSPSQNVQASHVDIKVDLKSITAVVPPQAAAIGSRIMSRYSQYQMLSPIWSVRPSQPVSACPAVWWQHACKVVLAECRRRRPPCSVRLALERRRKYMALYRSVHRHEARYITTSRDKKCPDLVAAQKALKAAEVSMTAYEVATHRIVVALLHSRLLKKHPALQHQWIEALDGLGGFVDLVPGNRHTSTHQESGPAVSVRCPAISLSFTTSQQPLLPQFLAEVHDISLDLQGSSGVAASVRQLQLLVRTDASRHHFKCPAETAAAADRPGLLPVLSISPLVEDAVTLCSALRSQEQQQQQQQQKGCSTHLPPSRPQPSMLGRIYNDSAITSYLGQLEVLLGPVLLQLQPHLAVQILAYYEAFRACKAADNEVLPVKQLVLDSFRMHKVPVSFALSSLVAPMSVTCPEVLVVAPLKHIQDLDGSTCEEQALTDTAVQLVARMNNLHASVGYNTSCYSSLLQQIDATADMEAFFQQQGVQEVQDPQQLCGLLWLHPDDANQVIQAKQSTCATSPAGAATSRRHSSRGAARIRSSDSGALPESGNLSGFAAQDRSLMSCHTPSVPLLKLRRVWTRLSTHIPTEPAVAGGERTAAGVTAAGVLAWLSPWQIKLVLLMLEQLTTEGQVLWQQFKDTLHPTEAGGFAAARDADAASAVHATIGGATEIGSAAAAASKATTAVVQTAGMVVPETVVYTPASAPPFSGTRTHQPLDRQPSVKGRLPALTAKTAGRASADQAAISLLCTLPYCEVLFFVDALAIRPKSRTDVRHRYVADVLLRPEAAKAQQKVYQQVKQQPPEKSGLLHQWSSRVVPVASLVLSDLRAGSSTAVDGTLEAKARLSSLLLVNLQLADLCKSATTMPTAAGIYLPSGYAVPAHKVQPASKQQTSTRCSQSGVQGESASPGSLPNSLDSAVASLSANHNAFVLSAFTTRLTATYQAAALSRAQVLGLDRLAATLGPSSCSSRDGMRLMTRGSIDRAMLLRQRWQQTLALRAFARTLDYAMFLLFYQAGTLSLGQHQAGGSMGRSVTLHPFPQYQMLYQHCIAETNAVNYLQSLRSRHSLSKDHVPRTRPQSTGSATDSWPHNCSGVQSRGACDTQQGKLGVCQHSRQQDDPCSNAEGPTARLLGKQQQSSLHVSKPYQDAAPATPNTLAARQAAASTPGASDLCFSPAPATPGVSGVSAITQEDPQASRAAKALLFPAAPVMTDRAPPVSTSAASEPAQAAEDRSSASMLSLLGRLRGGSQGLLRRLKQGGLKRQRQLSTGSDSQNSTARKALDECQTGSRMPVSSFQQSSQQSAQQQCSQVDFLCRFAASYAAAAPTLHRPAFCGSKSRHGTVVVSTPTSDNGLGSDAEPFGSSNWLVCPQQPQLAVDYKQQPWQNAGDLSQWSSAASSSAPVQEDRLAVSLSHLKVTIGPHSVSMLLQLVTSFTAAAEAAAGNRHAQASAGQAVAGSNAAGQRNPGGRMRASFNFVLCHVMLNMERVLLPGQSDSKCVLASELDSKALLSLLLLDAEASYAQSAPGPNHVADGSSQPSWADISCSVAHIGLQDLCACEEHRLVLSGAAEASQASDVTGAGLLHNQTQPACYLSLQASVPLHTAQPQPSIIAVGIHNCKLVLLRRFINDVLYVAALMMHESTAFRSCKGQSQQVPSRAHHQSASPVLLITLRNVKVVLPRSHACKTLADKYAEAYQLQKLAQQLRQEQAVAEQQGYGGIAQGGSSSSNVHGGVSTPTHEQHQHIQATVNRQDSSTAAPLHAHHAEVILLQASAVTIAAPADFFNGQAEPQLLGLGQSSMPDIPHWMHDSSVTRQIVASSRAVMSSSNAAQVAKDERQQQQQPQATTSMPAVPQSGDPVAGNSLSAAVLEPQQQQSAVKQVKFAADAQQRQAAAVRHGVLLMSEQDNLSAGADAHLAPVPKVSLSRVAGRVWQRLVRRLKPSRNRMIVRPDIVTGPSTPSKLSASTTGNVQNSKQSVDSVSASEGGTAAGAEAAHSGAVVLVDFHGLEMSAGRIVRAQDVHDQNAAGTNTLLSCKGVAIRPSKPSGCELIGLMTIVKRTNVQAVVHDHHVNEAAEQGAGGDKPNSVMSIVAVSIPDGMALQLSDWSYKCLMDMLSSNLMHNHSIFEAGSLRANSATQHHTTFQSQLKFGPKPGEKPSFVLTLCSSTVQGTLWADQRWWTIAHETPSQQQQQQQPQSHATHSVTEASGSCSNNSCVVPMVSALLQAASLCVQTMQGTSDLHVNLYAEDTEWRDVRMANADSDNGRASQAGCEKGDRRSEYNDAAQGVSASDDPVMLEQARQHAAVGSTAQRPSGVTGARPPKYHPLAEAIVPNRLPGNLVNAYSGPSTAHAEEGLPMTLATGYAHRVGAATTHPINLFSPADKQHSKPSAEIEDDASALDDSSDEDMGEQFLDASELYPSMLQPSMEGAEEVPDLSIIRTLDELPSNESVHLLNRGTRRRDRDECNPATGAGIKVYVGYLKEGTMTVEVVLRHTLLQWPYLFDMSLVSAIINVFHTDWGAAPVAPPKWLQLKRNPWLYFNLVLTDSQIFLPLLSPHISLTSSTTDLEQSHARLSPYQLLRQVVVRQASLTGEDVEYGRGQQLQQRGIALTFGAFRFGYYYGGDGEAITRFDIRNLAGFLRDPNAVTTNWLLPLPSAKLELRQEYPLVEEHRSLEPLLMITRRMIFAYLVRKREHRRKQLEVADAEAHSRTVLHHQGRMHHMPTQDRQDATSGSYATSTSRAAAAAAATPEQRLLALACEHAEDMFGEQVTASVADGWQNTQKGQRHAQSRTTQPSLTVISQSSSSMFGVYKRKARSELFISVAPITLRAAFSNIVAWKVLQSDMQLAAQLMETGLGMWPPQPDLQAHVLAVRAAGATWPPPPTGWAAVFQQSSMRCSARSDSVIVMLCDDKPHSFGAPDVLQALAHDVSFVHAVEYQYPKTAPETADRLHVEGGLGLSILNNSNSKWEVLLEPWPLLIALSNPINPLVKSDRVLYGSAVSSEALRVNFHPSSLLSVGDLLAFTREVSAVPVKSSSGQQLPNGAVNLSPPTLLEKQPGLMSQGVITGCLPDSCQQAPLQSAGTPRFLLQDDLRRSRPRSPISRRLVNTEAPPSIEQQLALGEGLRRRIPQRYLFQNLTGSHLYYWSPTGEGSSMSQGSKRRVFLPAHSMHELKVTPVPCKVQHLAADGSLVSSGYANSICIQLAGSWLPLTNVAVDVVGKYRYEAGDPLGGSSLPLLLDVLLVGRTKMLRLHSCIWLENNTALKLEPLLQLGHDCATPVVLGSGDRLDALQRLHLKPLKPKEGRFLPAAAALGGLLFLAPEGHLPTEHDVIRLDVSLKALGQQQGYIRCCSKPDGLQHGSLHLAASISQDVQTDPYFVTQNLTEVPRPGTLRKARMPLEAAIQIRPTFQLENGLPYDVLGWAFVPPKRDVLSRGVNSIFQGKAAQAATTARFKLPKHVGDDGSEQTDCVPATSDLHRFRMSSTGGPGVAQAAAAAAVAPGSNLVGLQQVLVQEGADMALAAMVSTAGTPMQILEQLSAAPQLVPPTPSTPTAQAARLRRQSWLHGGFAASNSLTDRTTGTPASPRAKGAGQLPPAATLKPAHPDERLQLSYACDMLLLQRWCRDMVLEEFLATLHLVLSPAVATKVDVAALCLMDLSSLLALSFGVVAEEFGWIAKCFPQAFSLLMKVEDAMQQCKRAATGTEAASADAAPETPQLPWPADQLPIPELLSLLQWMQQSVVRLQLGPGGTADLYLDPQLELYAALKVPALAMQSRPTLITSGLGSQSLGGSDSLWLSYASQLDSKKTVKPSSSNSQQTPTGVCSTMAGQPRLGLAALQSIRDERLVHEEVTIRMTDVARQLAVLASRMKISQSYFRTASLHGADTGGQVPIHGSYIARAAPYSQIPASVTAVDSAEDGLQSSHHKQHHLLHSWSSTPGAALPISFPATLDGQRAHLQLAVSSGQEDAESFLWFAVVIELLGDIARLSAHEADVRQGDGNDQQRRPGFSRHRFAPELMMDDLSLADISLLALAESLHQQAARAALAGHSRAASPDTASRKQAPTDHSMSTQPMACDDGRAAAASQATGHPNPTKDACEAGIAVDIEATVASITQLLLKPPGDVDRIFTQFNLQEDHVLSDDEMQALLRFSCLALVDHVVTMVPNRQQSLQPSPRDQKPYTGAGTGRTSTPGVISYEVAKQQSVPSRGSKSCNNMDTQSSNFSNSLSTSATYSPQLPPTPADDDSATNEHHSKHYQHGSQKKMPAQQVAEVVAETSLQPLRCPAQSMCGASSQHSSQDGGVPISVAPLKGLRSLRSLWPLHSGPAASSSAGRPRSADGSITADRQFLLASRRTTMSSNDDSEESAEEDEKASGAARSSWQGGPSFRRRPGASVKHLTRMMSRATGAPVRLVHGQLSEQLRAALDRKMKSTPHHMLPPGPVGGNYSSPHDMTVSGPGSGVLRHHGQQWWTMTLQALGRGAVAAEVHEGRPGFCAPQNLQLSLVSSGGGSTHGHRGAHSHRQKQSNSGSATLHVLLTASYWLDNRSGLNLVLSDMDRRLLRGLPGPQLKNTADVYTPGLPRDCASLDAPEPELSVALANDGTTGKSEQALQDWKGTDDGVEPHSLSGGTDAEVDAALSRLQEVRPALLNDQFWLRFWVEEHVFLPPGSLTAAKERRTLSFSTTPPCLANALSSPGAAASVPSPARDSPSDSPAAPVTSTGRVQAVRSQPSGFFKIGEAGHKKDIQVKGKKVLAQISEGQYSVGLPTSAEQSSSADCAAPMGQDQSDQVLVGRAALAALGAIGETAGAAISSSDSGLQSQAVWDPPIPLAVPVQRLYEFTAEIWPPAAEGPFKATKVVSIKSKYLLFNDTGLVLEYKQKGTPDPSHPGFLSYGQGRRFAGLLQPQERVAFHWDNLAEPRLLMIRPAAPGWPWSGAFPLSEKEDHIGLRLRHRGNEAPMIIPVNTTVGRSGTVLVTFKSTSSVPPIRIENRTKSVAVLLRQHLEAAKGTGMGGLPSGLPAKRESPRATLEVSEGWRWDNLLPGGSIPFAWDDVTGKETLEVVAAVLGSEMMNLQQILAGSKRNMFVLDLDSIQKRPLEIELRPSNWKLLAGTSHLAGSPASQPSSIGQSASLPALGPPSDTRRPLSAAAAITQADTFKQRQQQLQQQQHQQQQPSTRRMLSVRSGAQADSTSQILSMDGSATGGRMRTSSTAAGSSAAASIISEETKALRKVKDAIFDKKLYVSVFADGPTRVLCFSDTPMAGISAENSGGSQQLLSRLHQVTRQLMQVDHQLQLYLGSAYALRTARGSTAVPATLLLQQQQVTAPFKKSAQIPSLLHTAAGTWHTPSTTAAAIVLLQQLGLHPMTLQGGRQSHEPAAADTPTQTHGQRAGTGASQVPEVVVSGGPATSHSVHSHVSSRTAGAAAVAAATVSMSDGMLSVNNPDTGLKLYYDRLTLLLDSGLPLGGNCKVKLLSARGLASAGDQFSGYQAQLAVSGRKPVVTGLAAIGDQQEVVWEHEEQFSEVTTMSELVVEVWGIYSSTVFGKKGSHHGAAQVSSSHDEGKGNVRRQQQHVRSVPYGSKFLGAVQIPLMQTLPGTSRGGKAPHWHSILRVTGNQQFSGQVQISISWSFTREALLASELSVLERLLEARQEVLALLHPVSSNRLVHTLSMTPAASSSTLEDAAAHTYSHGALLTTDTAQVNQHEGSDSDDPHSNLGSLATPDAGVLDTSSPGSTPVTLDTPHQQPEGMSPVPLLSQSNVFAGMDLGLADSSMVTLEIDVVEVANLSPRSGWSQDLTRVLLSSASTSRAAANDNVMLSEMVKSSELPMPVVYVFCGIGQSTDEGFEVSSGAHTLNPCFAHNRHYFKRVSVRNVVRVLLYDRRSALDSRLLGVAQLPVASIGAAGSGPLYMWVPLGPAAKKKNQKLSRLKGYMPGALHGKDAASNVSCSGLAPNASAAHIVASGNAAQSQQQPQVLMRLRVNKPGNHNTMASLQANLAGLLVNAKTASGDELLNLSVDTVQCAMLTTTRERQLSVSVRSVQLDNQLLETRQPVVLSPATTGEELVGYNLPKDKHKVTLLTDKALDDMEPPAKAMWAALARLGGSKNVLSKAADTHLRVVGSGSSVSGAHRKVPFIRVSVCQTLTRHLNNDSRSESRAGQLGKGSLGATSSAAVHAADSLPPRSRTSGTAGTQEVSPSGSNGTGGARGSDNKSVVSKAAIMSFRKVELLMGALDLKTDQAFLEAVFMFLQNMPLADLWQNAAWQQHIALLQGSTSAQEVVDSRVCDQQQQEQQVHFQTMVSRRSTTMPESQPASGAADAMRQQLSTSVVATKLHAQQVQHPPSPNAFMPHSRSKSVGSFTNLDVLIQQPQQPTDARNSGVGSLAGVQESTASDALPETTSAAAARGSRKVSAARRAALNSVAVLAWLPEKHDQEINSMKGQSSTWYFIEKLYVSALCMNVTIALTSSIRSAAVGQSAGISSTQAPAAVKEAGDGLSRALGPGAALSEVQRTVMRGIVNRLSGGSNGLQLINVSDVSLRLSGFKLENRLLNQVGLNGELYRHYFWAGLAELRKVLGGAGPGLVQLPASIVWAGVSVVDLLLELQQGRRKPLHSAFALLHVAFTLLSQLSGVATRCIVSLYALLPVQRQGTLSDHSALQRYVHMPATAGEAFTQAVAELYLGTAAGVLGLFLDPAAGMRLPGALGLAGLLAGLLKGTGGLMVRPAMGVLDASSKCFKGVGLLFLGKRGIQGKLVRRVMPPGASERPIALAGSALPAASLHGSIASPGKAVSAASLHEVLTASWQARLAALSSDLEGDVVVDVMATRSCRLLLLTRYHVLYLRASVGTRGQPAGSYVYSIRWLLPCSRIDHVRGEEDRLKIVLEYHSQLRVPSMEAWKKGPAAAAAAGGKKRGPVKQAAAAEPVAEGGDGTDRDQQSPGASRGASDSRPGSRVLLRIPLQHSLRCASPELYQQVIRGISRHLVQTMAGNSASSGLGAAGAGVADSGVSVAARPTGLAGQASGGLSEYADLYDVS